MRLYLLRHAEAVDHVDDDARDLSEYGRKSLEPVAGWVRSQRLLPPDVEVWHSPLRRAVQTAQIFVKEAGFTRALQQRSGLRPEDDPEALLPLLSARGEALLLVGHEPFLSTLATLLLTDTVYPPKVMMEKASLLCLERLGSGENSAWCVRWHLPGPAAGTS